MSLPLSTTMYVKQVFCTQNIYCPVCGTKAVTNTPVMVFNIGYGEEFKVPQQHCRKCGCEEVEFMYVDD